MKKNKIMKFLLILTGICTILNFGLLFSFFKLISTL